MTTPPIPNESTPPSPYAASPAEALRLFRDARFVRFAWADEHGRPRARSLNAVLVDGALCFHGGDRGEKLGMLDRPTLAVVEEVVAQVPSYWVHPRNACPASTYYESAQAEGVVRRIEDEVRKAQVLEAIMQRFQPEGGYVPIEADHPRYAGVIRELLVAELVPERLVAKRKLGQKRSGAEILRVLSGLWARGEAGDLVAIRRILESHPSRPRPAFLEGPAGTRLCVAPDAADADAVATLLEGAYWTVGMTRAVHLRAHLGGTAWLVARDEDGRVVGSARAVSDRGRYAWILDVIVAPSHRGRGLGRALVSRLLDHPAVRGLRRVGLATRDAERFYASFGFEVVHGDGVVTMARST